MKEALKLALEALDGWGKGFPDNWGDLDTEAVNAIKEALAQSEQDNTYIYASNLAKTIWQKHYMNESPKFALLDTTEGVLTQIDNMTCGLVREKPAQPEQEPVAWKLMPKEPTEEMLKAMDECSTEGYDERLYAGHAASVYMAAWDAQQPQPERYITDAMKVRQAVAQALLDDVYAKELEQPEAKQSGTISITMPAPIAYLCENATGHKYFRWKKPASTYKPIPLYTTPPQRKPLTDEMIVAGGKALAKLHAETCGLDFDDVWKYYAEDHKADAKAAIEAAHGIKE